MRREVDSFPWRLERTEHAARTSSTSPFEPAQNGIDVRVWFALT
jgi:hypothetical protein